MSWLSDGWDAVTGLFDSGTATDVASEVVEPVAKGGWFTRNADWLKPVVGAGLNAWKQSQADDAQGQYLDYLRQREQANYDAYMQQANAYNAQLGQGGGGNNGAAAAAARATEANRMAASKKANRVSRKTYKKLLAMYAPYKQTADQLLPQMQQTYENSLGMQNSMLKYLNSPEQVAKLDAAGPAWNVNVPLPDSVRIK